MSDLEIVNKKKNDLIEVLRNLKDLRKLGEDNDTNISLIEGAEQRTLTLINEISIIIMNNSRHAEEPEWVELISSFSTSLSQLGKEA